MKNRKAPPFSLTFKPEPTADAILASKRSHRVAIIRQEGSNGDREMAASFHLAGFEVWDVHMSDLLDGRITLDASKGWAGSVLFSTAVAAQFRSFRERQDTFSV